MPYVLDDFPVEANEPVIEVDFPVGRYTLELVVVDSAGLESVADSVTIEVYKEQPPRPILETAEPALIRRSDVNAPVIVRGLHLGTASSVEFLLDGVPTSNLRAEIESATPQELVLCVNAEANAALTSYDIKITTLGGDSDPLPNGLRLAESPRITAFAPKSLGLGEEAFPFIIKGEFLRIQALADMDHAVELLLDGEPDPTIEVSTDAAMSNDEKLVLRIKAPEQLPTGTAARQIRIKTPAGIDVFQNYTFELTDQ